MPLDERCGIKRWSVQGESYVTRRPTARAPAWLCLCFYSTVNDVARWQLAHAFRVMLTAPQPDALRCLRNCSLGARITDYNWRMRPRKMRTFPGTRGGCSCCSRRICLFVWSSTSYRRHHPRSKQKDRFLVRSLTADACSQLLTASHSRWCLISFTVSICLRNWQTYQPRYIICHPLALHPHCVLRNKWIKRSIRSKHQSRAQDIGPLVRLFTVFRNTSYLLCTDKGMRIMFRLLIDHSGLSGAGDFFQIFILYAAVNVFFTFVQSFDCRLVNSSEALF